MKKGRKETDLGLIPDDWEQCILAKYAEKPQYGFTDSSSISGNAKFLRITDITDTGVNWNNVPFCNCPDIDKYKLINGDIVFARIGATTGKSYIINNPPNAVFASYLIRVRTKSKLLSDYLIYFFKSEYYWKQINSQKGNNLKGGVNGSILSDLKIIVPPLPEQRKIAYVLSTVQKAIEQQDKLIRHTTELKKALMQKLFTEGIKGEKQKQTEIGLVPESWEVQPFENTGDVVYGIQAAVASNLKPIGHKILTNKNITIDGKIVLEKINYFKLTSKRHFDTILQKGDLLFNWRSGSKEHVGKTAIFDLEDAEYVHSSFILRIRVNKNHNAKFLFFYLNYLREIGYYQKVQTFSINAKFNKSAINAMPIALPKRNIQDLIANTIEAVDAKIDNQIANYNLKNTLFKTLLHELMTGERRVHEIEFENKIKEEAVHG
jgi:type I restriction enzyme S subunit